MDDDLLEIKRLTRLNTLDLAASRPVNSTLTLVKGHRLTDAGLANLRGMANLDWLSLRDTQVTDGGLLHLETLRDLRVLDLNGLGITGEGLVHVRGLSKLSHLQLNRTTINDAGVAQLKGTSLAWLELNDTHITDTARRTLNAYRALNYLNLAGLKLPTPG